MTMQLLVSDLPIKLQQMHTELQHLRSGAVLTTFIRFCGHPTLPDELGVKVAYNLTLNCDGELIDLPWFFALFYVNADGNVVHSPHARGYGFELPSQDQPILDVTTESVAHLLTLAEEDQLVLWKRDQVAIQERKAREARDEERRKVMKDEFLVKFCNQYDTDPQKVGDAYELARKYRIRKVDIDDFVKDTISII